MSTWYLGYTSFSIVERAVGAGWGIPRGGGSLRAGRRKAAGCRKRTGRRKAGSCGPEVGLRGGMLAPRGEKFWQNGQPRAAAEVGGLSGSTVRACVQTGSECATAGGAWLRRLGRVGSTAETGVKHFSALLRCVGGAANRRRARRAACWDAETDGSSCSVCRRYARGLARL